MEKPPKHVSITQHHPCEGLGLIADVLNRIAVLGANVCPGRQKEIARHWVARSNSAVGSASVPARGRDLFLGEPSSPTAFHWHGDIFDLPHGATLPASSALTAHQAFRYGKDA
jgi:GMP synthase (glutamine-hydrolysing)